LPESSSPASAPEEGEAYHSVEEIDFEAITGEREYFASPDAWEDQVLYFLLVDRFSDGSETNYRGNNGKTVRSGGPTGRYGHGDFHNAVKTEKGARAWAEAGDHWVGGNLKGLATKLGYLKRLGVTAIWLSPLLKQPPWAVHDYHGYGTQDFLRVDPRFGTGAELREFVRQAHEFGIYVILDIICNHAGDVFEYDPDRYEESGPDGNKFMDPRWDGEEYAVKGWRDGYGAPNLPFETLDLKKYPYGYPDCAVWPRELQTPGAFHRKGYMCDWDNFPEFVDADFFGLKDFDLGWGDESDFHPSPTLDALVRIYQYWIAYADIDGYRVDTVKHMGVGAVNYFAGKVKEFAANLGKRNFYLIGEIAGGRGSAHNTLQRTTLDAALGLDEIPEIIRDVVTGRQSPEEYFRLFHNTRREGEAADDPTWWKSHVVTFFDDHDQVGRRVKGRFASEFREDMVAAERAVLRGLALDLMTLGIPCIYYGTEQGFNGHAFDEYGGNRYIREAMFGGGFGAFGSKGKHFFNEASHLYVEIQKLLTLKRDNPALRRGRQFLRPVSELGDAFNTPEVVGDPYSGVIAWTRLLDIDEFVIAINTDNENAKSVWVTLDSSRNGPGGDPLTCVYSTDPEQIGTQTSGGPEERNGSAVCITVPVGGVAIFR